jgi:hypothetical protein
LNLGGNIDEDPRFLDSGFWEDPYYTPGDASDDVWVDGNYHLLVDSPCINVGDPSFNEPNQTDIDGQRRVQGGRVDMGADEYDGPIFVDDDAPDDPAPGDPNASDPLENGSLVHPFDTIQEAIDVAVDTESAAIYPGEYVEELDFLGKAITVQGVADNSIPAIQALGGYAVSFYDDEGPNSVLKNFVIRNSDVGVFLVDAFPTLHNLTIVDNDTGVAAYAGAAPDISNCILFNNTGDDLFQCDARYSCVEGGGAGLGNITKDPCFADANGGDYRLLSEGWRWSADQQEWVFDDVTSPCIDAGNPGTLLRDELMSVPNDPDNVRGVNIRVNMGAYGGTSQAGIGPHGWVLLADLNNDGIVDWLDTGLWAQYWLDAGSELPADLDRNGKINGFDYALFGLDWSQETVWR